MWTMLAGVPGKLTALLGRLTSTRATNLDRLDTTITSRAQQSSALSNAVWTEDRATKLDGIQVSPLDRPPIANGLFGYPQPVESANQINVGTYTILNVTGSGVINLAVLRIYSATNQSSNPITATATLNIDGLNVISITAAVDRNNVFDHRPLLGMWTGGEANIVVPEAVPFLTSFSLTLQVTASSGVAARSARMLYRYRRTS